MAPRAQVGASCDSLEAHFDDRQALRGQERTALTDAIAVRACATSKSGPKAGNAACTAFESRYSRDIHIL